ncbi:MAG: efflux RND transporter periplasmic adaptor subunit [Butyricicoccaceae bacterium]
MKDQAMAVQKPMTESENGNSKVSPFRRIVSLLPFRKKQATEKRSFPKKRKTLILVVTILLLVTAFGLYRLFFAQEERIEITGTTTFGFLNEAIEGSGTTTPADSVSYEINGTVLEWLVATGDQVNEGDLLYVLDSSEVEDEILEYEVELEDLYEQLSDLQESIASQNVTAPFSGRIQDIRVEAADQVQSGTTLATLVDDSYMKATLYFSYAYESDIQTGMTVTASVPDQMLNLSGTVTDVRYVDYVTTEGMKCFAVTIRIENPGSLAEGTSVSCWVDGANGAIYPATDANLAYDNYEVITAGATGELTSVNVVDYQRVSAGQTMFRIDASGYETQMETIQKQIENYEEKIADAQETIDTEYTRYSDISGKVVSAAYSTNRMTGSDIGSVVIYNQDSMQISINVDELDADYLTEGMDVRVYRTTSSKTVDYPATLTYLSLEATSGNSGVSTFAATITIDSAGELSSGVTVYYSIDTSGNSSGVSEETVLAPVSALASYDDGYYLLVQSETKPENTIDPAQAGGSITEYPKGYYAVPVEVGDFNETYVQILSGVEADQTLFLRYMNAAPSGGDTTSTGGQEGDESMMPGFGEGNMPNFGGNVNGNSGGGMPNFGDNGGGGMPNSVGMP